MGKRNLKRLRPHGGVQYHSASLSRASAVSRVELHFVTSRDLWYSK